LGAEACRLAAHHFHQLRTVDAFRKAGKIFHQGGPGKLTAGLHAADQQRAAVAARGIDGGGVTGRAGTEYDLIMNVFPNRHGKAPWQGAETVV